MIPQEIKEKIFALYWGQRIVIDNSITMTHVGLVDNYLKQNEVTDEDSLQLKSLSDISDEDAIGLAKIILEMPFSKHDKGWKVSRDYAITGWPYIKVHNPKNVYSLEVDCKLLNFNVYDMEDTVTSSSDMKPCDTIDFLRSKGYAVPYLTYSVEQLIEEGVFKIKQA